MNTARALLASQARTLLALDGVDRINHLVAGSSLASGQIGIGAHATGASIVLRVGGWLLQAGRSHE
jgi:hypothetical protein